MLPRKPLLAAACALLCALPPCALAEPVTSVAQGRYFLSYPTAAYLSAETPPAVLDAMKKLCEAQQPLYRHGAAAPAKCARYGSADQNGDRVAALSIVNAKVVGLPARKAAVYSTQAFAPDRWLTRPPLAQEAQRVRLALSGRLLGPAFQAVVESRSPEIDHRLDGQPSKVIEALDRKYTLYIVPWAVSEDGELTPNTENLVLRANGSGYSILGNLTGEIVDAVDLDGDGVVELQVSRAGHSEAVYSFKSGSMEPVLELK